MYAVNLLEGCLKQEGYLSSIKTSTWLMSWCQPLTWFQSYLADRTQVVNINGSSSTKKAMPCGVPQGSVLGPLLFSLYMAGLGQLMKDMSIPYHHYADDNQLYLSFDLQNADSAVVKLEESIKGVREWMTCNFLRLNEKKSEFVIIQPRWKKEPEFQKQRPIVIGEQIIPPISSAKNIGVFFDSAMTMERHIVECCKACYFHLRNIGLIKKKLTQDSIKTVIRAFVISRLDSNNALYCGLPSYLLDKLQRVQNSAARLVSGCSRRSHITPVLEKLHWLPIRQRVTYKLCFLVFKSLKGMSPQYISDLLQQHKPSRTLRSSTRNILSVPLVKTVTVCIYSAAGLEQLTSRAERSQAVIGNF